MWYRAEHFRTSDTRPLTSKKENTQIKLIRASIPSVSHAQPNSEFVLPETVLFASRGPLPSLLTTDN